MLRPTADQLAALSRTERIGFELGDLVNSKFSGLSKVWNGAFVGVTIWVSAGHRLNVHGLESIEHLGPQDRVILVANHRSFFDLFVVSAAVFWRTKLSKRVLCPVRSTFFYDHPLGPAVNLTMSGMAMFPPILRDRQRGVAFNRYSLERCIDELGRPGTVIGLHPEGTRNKNDDPYSFLPAQPGVGKIALEAKEAHVIPVFIYGVGNDLRREIRYNWTTPGEHPIDVVFGPEVDLADLRAGGSRATTQKRAADRCLSAIAKLAEAHRDLARALIAQRSSR